MNDKLGKYLGKKFIKLISLLVALTVITFILAEMSPIDPIEAYTGYSIKVSPEQKEIIAEYWGLDKPPMERFLSWGSAVLHGDFGVSMIYHRPVVEVIGERFLASLALMMVAWVMSGVIGFILGILAGMKEGSILDKLIKGYCYLLSATPTFWLCLILLMVFSVSLGWFPIGLGVPIGVLSENVTIWQLIQHMILPACALSIIGVANIALHTREKLVEVMNSDYVLFAKARGESIYQIIKGHGIRNIIIPAITLQFLSFSELFAGAVLAEQVFSYPGLGQATVQAGLRGDIPLLLGIVLATAIFIFMGNLIADLLYLKVDPRMKEGRR